MNAISGNGVMRAAKRKEGRFLPLLALSDDEMMKVFGKGVTIAGRRYNKMNYIQKNV